jgi:hypothetical protein
VYIHPLPFRPTPNITFSSSFSSSFFFFFSFFLFYREKRDIDDVKHTPARRLGLYLSQTRREIRKRRGAFCLGFTCVLLVVVIVAVADNALANTPVVFLNLARGERGDADMRLAGRLVRGKAGSLNTTEVEQRLGSAPGQEPAKGATTTERFLVSPRNEANLVVFGDTAARRALGTDPFEDTAWPYDANKAGYAAPDNVNCDFDGSCYLSLLGSNAVSTRVVALDAERETAGDIGTALGLKSLSARDCLVTQPVAALLEVEEGDTIFVRYNLVDYPYAGAMAESVPRAWWTPNRLLRTARLHGTVLVPFNIARVVRSTAGKLESRISSAIFVSLQGLSARLAQHANPGLEPTIRDSIANNMDTREFAERLLVSFEGSRTAVYTESDFDILLGRVAGLAARALYRVGFDQVDVDLPLLRGMYETRFFALFLGLILIIVVWILSLLSILLISSLMTVSVETRTFELGMMRMAGMKRQWIVEMLMVHAATYAIPAWALGLTIAQVIAGLLARTVFSSAGSAARPMLRPTSIVLSTALGLGIPVLAAALPIRRALGKSLVESLDTQRSKTKAVTVTITRSQDASVSPAILVVGSGLVFFGFLIVYVVPLALLSGNFGLLLNVFFGLLLGMMLGLVILSINVTQSIERLLTWVFFFWDRRSVGDILRKNLIAHRLRNRKTSMMYACTVGFIVFILVAVRLQITSFTYGVQQRYGTPIVLRTFSDGVKGDALYALDSFVRGVKGVKDVAYVSYSLGAMLGADRTAIKNIGRTFSFTSGTVGT